MGGGPKAPKAVEQKPPVETPKEKDPVVQEAAAEALRRKKKQQGFRATIVSRDMMSEDVAKKLETLGS